jgi:two-component system, chemotaxis family, protein-glutamate methylesterase/glutaminase
MTQTHPPENPIKLLIVDDSWVLRRVLRGTLSQRDDVKIVGEATNGVEALGMILELGPDVVMLDAEMPLMDGMMTLQHLMIHTPVPTIMLSSLCQAGSPRSFDALKYGAVDFISKNSFFQGIDGTAHSKLVIQKVIDAAHVVVPTIDLMNQGAESGATSASALEKVVFCEDCGARNSFKSWQSIGHNIKCQNCGDEISLIGNKRYRRMNYITVIGAGEGGYANLLQIIPNLNPEMGGAIFIMIHDQADNVESFAQYLDAISDFQVILGENGMTVEGGCCYVFPSEKQVELSPFSGQYRLQVTANPAADPAGVIDRLMTSTSALLRHRVSGVVLSGKENDGKLGMEAIKNQNGSCMVLNPDYCLHKSMPREAYEHLKLQEDLGTAALAVSIQKCHFGTKENVITA